MLFTVDKCNNWIWKFEQIKKFKQLSKNYKMKIQYESNGITIFESVLYRTTSTIVHLNESILIIDPNWLPLEIDFILNYIEKNYKNHIQYLVLTHSDYDHIIGYGAFPDAQVIASKYLQEQTKRDDILQQIKDFDQEFYIKRNYPISYPIVDKIISHNGEKIHIDGYEMILYHAHGHVDDGIFLIIPKKHLWIVGDYLSNIEIPFVDHSFSQYVNTIETTKNIFHSFSELSLLIVGHGDHEVNRFKIKSRIDHDEKYLTLLGLDAQNLLTTEKKEELQNLISQYSTSIDFSKAHAKNINMVKNEFKKES